MRAELLPPKTMTWSYQAEIFPGHCISAVYTEDMVYGFTFEISEECNTMPLLKERGVVDMRPKIKDSPNIEDCLFLIDLNGHKAPVSTENFEKLVERKFYDAMETQRAVRKVVVRK